MGRYQFHSVGGAIGDSLVDTLTQRREEARRQMLADVEAKDSESRRKLLEEQTRNAEALREREMLEQAENSLDMGADLSSHPMLPILQKYGKVGANPAPTPSVSTAELRPDGMGGELALSDVNLPGGVQADNAPIQPKDHNYYFKGTREQQDRERRRANLGALAGSQKDPSVANMLATLAAMDGEQLPAGYWQASQPRVPMSVFDEDTGKGAPYTINGEPVLAGPGDPSVLTRRRTPREPTPANNQLITGPDGKVYWADPRTRGIVPAVLPGGANPTGKLGSTGSGSSANAKNYDNQFWTQGTSQNLAKLRAKADSPGASDLDEANYYSAAVNAVNTAKVSDPSIREAVMNVLEGRHPLTGEELDPNTEAWEIGTEMLGVEGVKPAEVQQFISLLRAIREY